MNYRGGQRITPERIAYLRGLAWDKLDECLDEIEDRKHEIQDLRLLVKDAMNRAKQSLYKQPWWKEWLGQAKEAME